jgi:uncharacterized membrane protein YraQ (UPF0718 family)
MASKVAVPAFMFAIAIPPDFHVSPFLVVGVFVVSLVAVYLHYRCYAYHWQRRTVAARNTEQRIIDDQIALNR